jgi:hypothetical protein
VSKEQLVSAAGIGAVEGNSSFGSEPFSDLLLGASGCHLLWTNCCCLELNRLTCRRRRNLESFLSIPFSAIKKAAFLSSVKLEADIGKFVWMEPLV